MIGELTHQEINALLMRQHVGHLGMYGNGRVFIFPVSYGYDGRDIYLQSHEGLKVRLMRGHPEVCFEVEAIEGPGRWRTVVCHGSFEELTEEHDRDHAFAAMAGHGEVRAPDSIAPYVDGPDAMVVYRICITELHGRFEHDEPLVLHHSLCRTSPP